MSVYLSSLNNIINFVFAGSYRRKQEVVGSTDILVHTKDNFATASDFLNYVLIEEVIKKTKDMIRVVLISGMIVTLHFIPKNQWSTALVYYTGSQRHLRQLKKFAKQNHLELKKEGLFKEHTVIATPNEKKLYSTLGLRYIEPELREGKGELEASKQALLPKLITLDNLRGDLHSHTTETDGTASLEEMVDAAIEKGYEYLAITDHTKRLAITNGLNEERLLQQIRQIDKLNGRLKNFRILKGSEVDILEDGSLDLPDWILKELDMRVCSLHSRFNYPIEKQTERILRAMENPYFNILGHPTGRLIHHRKPYPLNLEIIFKAAKARGCIMELNAQPSRLDLNDQYGLMAKHFGVKFAISSDAHSIRELDNIRFGINQARRGWLEPQDVINTKSITNLLKLLTT